ncbi:hypothetical protein TWF970_003493 [Orbilia oligospora]|uniref:F-box domain-containing protein n=1 Tax=Orbilia oligospora TaxID=2813651 RepID=A0A7C8RJ50_ORBOL|nr:hypothetical protein TWF970_003493 [Orbilia oligospora]
MAQTTSIQLPVETLSQIFSYLSFADQLIASLTCHLWQDIIFNSKLLRRRRYHPEGQKDGYKLYVQPEQVEYHHRIHMLFDRESSLLLTIHQGKLEHIIAACNYQSIDIISSPVLDEPMMVPLDIDESLPPDEDDNSDNELHKKEHCYCDPCMELTGKDGRMTFEIYYITFPDKDTSSSKHDSYGSKDKKITPHETIRDVVNLIAQEGIFVFKRHKEKNCNGEVDGPFYMKMRFNCR